MKDCQRACWLFAFVWLGISQLATCEYIKAESKVCGDGRNAIDTDGYKMFQGQGQNCSTSLRQIYRLLHASDSLLVGSSECVYVLDPATLNITAERSLPITTEGANFCESVVPRDQVQYRCKNYITVGEQLSDTAYYICGTNNAATPMCSKCSRESLTCESPLPSSVMSRDPNQNVTIALASPTTSGTDPTIYYVAAVKTASGDDEVFARMQINNGMTPIETLNNDHTWMYAPINFVGKPIEYDNFVFFFFRERAEEYDNLGRIIYSRVARVCKNDVGGTTSPLDGKYTTYLKTRLRCSVGSGFPFFFNEIQDVRQAEYDNSTVYGVFTTASAGTSSSAICRYDLDEINSLFNGDNRRGQLLANQVWKSITRDVGDTVARRTCSEAYPTNIYTHISSYPFMNTPAPNCELNAICSNYQRDSNDPLVVIEGVRAQTMAIQEANNTHFVVFIGTNNRTIYKVTVNGKNGRIDEKINLKEANFTATDIANKWPHGVSTLEYLNGTLYGTTDGYVFKLPVVANCNLFTNRDDCLTNRGLFGCAWDQEMCSLGNSIPDDACPSTTQANTSTPGLDEIKDRSCPQRVNFTVNIDNAVVTVSRLYEGPLNSVLSAQFFGDFENQTCQSCRFVSKSGCREFLAVHCEIRNLPDGPDFTGTIQISSATNLVAARNYTVDVPIDDTSVSSIDSTEINNYDLAMAEYEYKFQQWLDQNVTCGDASNKGTCPVATDCKYCQP